MSYRGYQRGQYRSYEPPRARQSYTIVQVEEVYEDCPEDEWVNNPTLFHRTNSKGIRLIDQDGFLDPEECTMKEALCEHCSWGVCFSVENSSPAHGQHVLSGPQLEVLRGSWFCYALRREKGYVYGGDRYERPFVTILFSRDSSPPCEHYSRKKAQEFIQFVDGKRFFNVGSNSITVVVQERVPLSVLSHEYDHGRY